MTTNTQIIIIKESAWESVVSDAGSFVTAIAMVGVGWAVDSAAMQWLGAVLFLISMLAQGSKKWTRMSIADARKRLDDIEAGDAKA